MEKDTIRLMVTADLGFCSPPVDLAQVTTMLEKVIKGVLPSQTIISVQPVQLVRPGSVLLLDK